MRDIGTWPITRDLLELFPANMVRGLVPRTHLDYNRPPECAFELPQFADSYAAYHGAIFQRLQQMRTVYPVEELLVLDMHSFPKDPPERMCDGYDLVLGTAHRETMLYGQPDRAFGAFMRARGYSVFVPDVKPVRGGEQDHFAGGFTVRTIAKVLRVNALQIEIAAPKFCTRNSALAGTKLSADIAAFLSEYYGR